MSTPNQSVSDALSRLQSYEFARAPAPAFAPIDTQLDALTIMARLMREAFPSASDRKLEAA
jgi:hypothetical protein